MARILLTIDVHNASRGGASEYVTQLAEYLGQRGYEVSIACHRSEAAASKNFRVITPPQPQSDPSPYARARHLQNRVNQERVDLVHDTGACLLKSDLYHPLMGSRLHNEYRQLKSFPWLRALRHIRHTQTWNWARLQWSQSRNHRWLVACSRRVAQDFSDFRLPTHALISNGIQLPRLAPEHKTARLREELQVGDRLFVLATSNNHYLKGILSLLQSLDLAGPQIRRRFLVVVAGHNEDPIFQNFIQARGLGDCARLLNWVADIDLYYQAADIFLHPTYHDAGSLSTLKALACGKAVITTRWDGSADLIEDGKNGLVLSANSPPAIFKALLRLTRPELRLALGVEALKLRKQVDSQVCFGKIERLYREVLGK